MRIWQKLFQWGSLEQRLSITGILCWAAVLRCWLKSTWEDDGLSLRAEASSRDGATGDYQLTALLAVEQQALCLRSERSTSMACHGDDNNSYHWASPTLQAPEVLFTGVICDLCSAVPRGRIIPKVQGKKLKDYVANKLESWHIQYTR